MKCAVSNMVRSARSVIVVVLLGRSVPALAQAPDPATGLDDQFRAQCKTVLSAPDDVGALRRLTQLGARLRDERRAALDALARGLAAYAAGQAESASGDLSMAITSRYVVELANAVLAVPLEKMVPGRHRRAETVPADCASCFGTEWVICRRCNGMGMASLCPNCRGTGYTSAGRGCTRCGSTGVLNCIVCRGTGFVKCPKCSSQTGTNDETKPEVNLKADEHTVIEELILKADYLRAGGIDYFTADGLRCAPRPDSH